MVALLADEVVIENNQIVSGELDFAALDVVAGFATAGQTGCPAGGDGPVPGTVTAVDLEVQADGSVLGEATVVLCYRNVGDEPALIEMRLVNVKSGEVGPCSPGEADVDTGCAATDGGELLPTKVAWAGCGENNSNPFTGDGTIIWDRDIAQPGEFCDDVAITFTFEAPPATAPALQSDTLLFDIRLDAAEPV